MKKVYFLAMILATLAVTALARLMTVELTMLDKLVVVGVASTLLVVASGIAVVAAALSYRRSQTEEAKARIDSLLAAASGQKSDHGVQ